MSEKDPSQPRIKRQKRKAREMSSELSFKVSMAEERRFNPNIVDANIMNFFKFMNKSNKSNKSSAAMCAPRSREWAVEADLVILDSDTSELVFAAMGDAIPGIVIKDDDQLKIALDRTQFEHLERYFSDFRFSKFAVDKETLDFLIKESAVKPDRILKNGQGYYLINPEKVPPGHTQMIAEQQTMQRKAIVAKVQMALQSTSMTKETPQNHPGVGPQQNRPISQSQQIQYPQKLQTRPMTAPGFGAHSANVSGFRRQLPVTPGDEGQGPGAIGAAFWKNASQPLMTTVNSASLQPPPVIGNPRSTPFPGIRPNGYNSQSSMASSSHPGGNTMHRMSMPPPQQNGRSISTGSYFGNPTAGNGHVPFIGIPGSNLGSQDPSMFTWPSIQGRDGTGSHPSFRAMGRPTAQTYSQSYTPAFTHTPGATGTTGVNDNTNGHMMQPQMVFHPQPSAVPEAGFATGGDVPTAMHQTTAGEVIQQHEAPLAPAATENVEENNNEALQCFNQFNDLLNNEGAFAGPSEYQWDGFDIGANAQ